MKTPRIFRKILCIALATILLLSLASCGTRNAPEPVEDDTAPPNTSATKPLDDSTPIETSSVAEESPQSSSSTNVTGTSSRDNLTTTDQMDPESLMELFRTGNRRAYIYSSDYSTRAYIAYGGFLSYNYNAEWSTSEPAPAPAWQDISIPEWATLSDEWTYYNTTCVSVDIYLDLPSGRLDAIEPGCISTAYSAEAGTLCAYPTYAILYKDGIEQQSWDWGTELKDNYTCPGYGDWFYDGAERLIRLNEDGSIDTVDHVVDFYLEDGMVINVLVLEDGILTHYREAPKYDADGINDLEARVLVDGGVSNATFSPLYGALWYSDANGGVYALDTVTITKANGETEDLDGLWWFFENAQSVVLNFVYLGDRTLEHYEEALRVYYARDDLAPEVHGAHDFYARCAAGEY